MHKEGKHDLRAPSKSNDETRGTPESRRGAREVRGRRGWMRASLGRNILDDSCESGGSERDGTSSSAGWILPKA